MTHELLLKSDKHNTLRLYNTDATVTSEINSCEEGLC